MVDTARRAVAELAAAQHRAFTRKQAAELNFDHRRITTAKHEGWLIEPRPGVLALNDGRPNWEQRLSIVLLASGGRAVASHRTAARLHDLDGFNKAGNATLEVSVTNDIRFIPGISAVVHHVHALEACDITTVRGLRCVRRERALAELGSVVNDVQMVRRALDGIPWEGQVPATWFEELLALCLDDPALPPMKLQHPIADDNGVIVARPDIAFPSVMLGLEAHSREFHWGEIAQRLDEERDIAAALCGWELTYLGWYATKRPAEVLGVVKRLVDVRRRNLHPGAA
jgi:hypothetical protein